ncbi:MAG TPA: hypothetical protein VH590_17400, partial [Ktedonobacterales bacterium]
MRTIDPSQSETPFDDERPTQPLVPGESFGAGYGAEADSGDLWLRQTGPTRVVDSQPPGGSG